MHCRASAGLYGWYRLALALQYPVFHVQYDTVSDQKLGGWKAWKLNPARTWNRLSLALSPSGNSETCRDVHAACMRKIIVASERHAYAGTQERLIDKTSGSLCNVCMYKTIVHY